MSYASSGLSLEESKAGQQSFLIFGLALLLVYLTLAAEVPEPGASFIVLLGVPLAVLRRAGRAVESWLRQRRVLPGRNCHAGRPRRQERDPDRRVRRSARGAGARDQAAIEAARIRLRPILMTSLAFILGVLPLAFATGAGSEARNSVGTTVAGGMFVSTFLSFH